jgi:hypothetical protein
VFCVLCCVLKSPDEDEDLAAANWGERQNKNDGSMNGSIDRSIDLDLSIGRQDLEIG